MPAACRARYLELGGPGSGWSVCVQPTLRPAKVRTQEHRAQLRQGHLVQRIQKRAPLFAEQLAQRPDYFAGEAVEVEVA